MLIWTPKTDDPVQLEKHAADLLQNPTTFCSAAMMNLRITIFYLFCFFGSGGEVLFCFFYISIQLISELTKETGQELSSCVGLASDRWRKLKDTKLMFKGSN